MCLHDQGWCDTQVWENAVALDNDRVRKRPINISTEVITNFLLLISFHIKYAGVSSICLNLPRVFAIPTNLL